MPETQDQSCGMGQDAQIGGGVQRDPDLGGGGDCCHSEKNKDAGNEKVPEKVVEAVHCLEDVLKQKLKEMSDRIKPKSIIEKLRLDRAKYASRVTALDNVIDRLENNPELVKAFDDLEAAP